jgi:hypothetical protein
MKKKLINFNFLIIKPITTMNRLFLAITICISTIGFVKAQDLEAIKAQVLFKKYKEAKAAIDKATTVEKTAKKPETWLLKTAIYTALATDSTTPKATGNTYLNDAAAAFKKYKEIDPKFSIVTDANYNSGPISLYSAYFRRGVDFWGTKEYQPAYDNFMSAVEMADFLGQAKVINISMDTVSILYAGASAQFLKQDENALKNFVRLANAKVSGADNEFLYQFIINNYIAKKDDANVEKYLAVATGLYPNSKYFPAVAEDYKNSKDPYFISMSEGEDLFDKLYPKNEKDAVQENRTEMENKMVAAFLNVVAVKPEKAGLAYTNIGNHFINKGVAANKKINEASNAIRAFSSTAKPDSKGKVTVPKDLLLKKDSANMEYKATVDKAIENYELASDAYSKKATLEGVEKQAYKNGVSFLIDLYAEKKLGAKAKPAEAAKFAAAEKKWSDVYSKLK